MNMIRSLTVWNESSNINKIASLVWQFYNQTCAVSVLACPLLWDGYYLVAVTQWLAHEPLTES